MDPMDELFEICRRKPQWDAGVQRFTELFLNEKNCMKLRPPYVAPEPGSNEVKYEDEDRAH